MQIKRIYESLSVKNRSVFFSYALAVSTALSIFFAHNPSVAYIWHASPFLIFLPFVVVTSWYGGFLPGLVATIVATIVGDYFFLNPLYTFTIADNADLIRLILFTTVGLLISIINQTFYNQKAERERLMKQIALSEGRFKTIANTTPVMLWILDKNLRAEFINNTFQDYTGSLKNETWLDIMHPEERHTIQKVILEALKKQKKFQFECRLKNKSGQYHWMLMTGIPNITSDNVFNGFLGTCIDINEEKHIAEQKTTFLSTVAHELRTPLATAQLINDLLLNKFKKIHGQEEVSDLENMHIELTSLSNLVQDLLQFVRGEQGELPIHTSQISLTQLIRQVIDTYQKAHPDFFISFSEKENYFVKADGKRIKQILYNLLDNATRASKPKDSIEVSIKKNNSDYVIRVVDHGVGIPVALQKHIFQKFYQTTENTHGGFGLGLYIAKQIIEKHHGKIWVESYPKKGSTFSFSLPL